MKTQEQILSEMAEIKAMARGKLCLMRKSKEGREYYSLQAWKNGRNVTEYVPQGKVEKLRAATEGYARFMKLVEEYVDLMEKKTMG